MPTAAEYLTIAYNQACARLAELDALPIDEKVRGTYTVSGVAVDWNAYRQHLLDEIAELGGKGDQPGLIQAAAGPWTVYG